MRGGAKKAMTVSILSLLPLILFLAVSEPQESPDKVSVNELVAEALRNNPSLAAARYEWKAERARVLPAGLPPNPVVEIGAGMIPADDFGLGNAGMTTISVSQEIPFPGMLYANHAMASHAARAAGEMYNMKEREIVMQVKHAYYELYASHESIRIVQGERALLEGLVRAAQANYELRKAGLGDVLKMDVELSMMETNLAALEAELKVRELKMNALLQRKGRAGPGMPEAPSLKPLRLTVDAIDSLALLTSPELGASREALSAAAYAHSASKMSYFPDLMLTVKRQNYDVGMDTWEIMLSAEVPLFALFRENENLEETGAGVASARASLENSAAQKHLAVGSSYAAYEAARRMLELYEKSVLPQAENSFKSALGGYQNGTSELMELLESERTLLALRLEYVNAKVEYEKSIAELEMIVGADLERE